MKDGYGEQQRRRLGGGLAPLNKICPPPLARGLARHNKRFTTEEIIKTVATMSDFKAKMYQIVCRTPLGELTALPQAP